MKPYYYVYEYGNKAPRIRHATLEQAETEAKRLAETSPGTIYEILMAVGLTKVTTPETFWMDGIVLHRCVECCGGFWDSKKLSHCPRCAAVLVLIEPPTNPATK